MYENIKLPKITTVSRVIIGIKTCNFNELFLAMVLPPYFLYTNIIIPNALRIEKSAN